MNITVIGTGYVGLVVAACLAENGNRVIAVDIDADKIERLKRGEIPIYEPGLGELVTRNVSEERLSFTVDFDESVRRSKIRRFAFVREQHLGAFEPGGGRRANPLQKGQFGEQEGQVGREPGHSVTVPRRSPASRADWRRLSKGHPPFWRR